MSTRGEKELRTRGRPRGQKQLKTRGMTRGMAPGQKAIQDPGPGPGQSLQDPGHLPRLPPPGTATGCNQCCVGRNSFCDCTMRCRMSNIGDFFVIS